MALLPEAEDSATPYPEAFAHRLAAVTERIRRAAARAGRDPAEVKLVGVSKGQPLEHLQDALAAGLRIFGENRVQEAEGKIPQLPPPTGSLGDGVEGPLWHLIGPLQSNKSRRAAELFSTVHSIDRPKIARRLERDAGNLGKTLEGFLQVNVGREDSKHGFAPEELLRAAEALRDLQAVRLVGLMAIPPQEADPEDARHWFRDLARLRDELGERGFWRAGRGYLSMGMSGDFEVAIEEGATHVRVGTALFGPRLPQRTP